MNSTCKIWRLPPNVKGAQIQLLLNSYFFLFFSTISDAYVGQCFKWDVLWPLAYINFIELTVKKSI